MRLGRRFGAVVASITLVAGGATTFVLWPASAHAAPNTHQVTLRGGVDNGPYALAVENTAVVTLQCNGATGHYRFVARHVQVIGSDHLTPWDSTQPYPGHYWIALSMHDPAFDHVVEEFGVLTQDDQAGLFKVSSSGTMDPGACQTGASLEVNGGSAADQYNSLDLAAVLP